MLPTKNYKSYNNKTVTNKYIRENYKSYNNKNVPNKYKGKTTNVTTKNYKCYDKKLQMLQQKTTNLPTIKMSQRISTNLPTIAATGEESFLN